MSVPTRTVPVPVGGTSSRRIADTREATAGTKNNGIIILFNVPLSAAKTSVVEASSVWNVNYGLSP